jgi:DNA mismatch endonuclease, patch repair protein
MSDVFTKRKRSEVMARIRGRGNRDTELALAKLLRAHGVTGWRRQQKLRIEGKRRRAGPARPTNVGIDFLFPKARVAVFVDGCFWHGCPKHSNPKKWIGRSSMRNRANYQPSVVREAATNRYQTEEERQRSFDKLRMTKHGEERMTTGGKRTGKAFWREKMAGNIARDRFVNRELRKQGWRVVRIWEHELGKGGGMRAEGVRRRRGYGGQGSQKVAEKVRNALSRQRSASGAWSPKSGRHYTEQGTHPTFPSVGEEWARGSGNT